MTKAELIQALADFPDDGEIYLDVGGNPAIPIDTMMFRQTVGTIAPTSLPPTLPQHSKE